MPLNIQELQAKLSAKEAELQALYATQEVKADNWLINLANSSYSGVKVFLIVWALVGISFYAGLLIG